MVMKMIVGCSSAPELGFLLFPTVKQLASFELWQFVVVARPGWAKSTEPSRGDHGVKKPERKISIYCKAHQECKSPGKSR